MSGPILYGSKTVITAAGGMVQIDEEKYNDGDTVIRRTRYTESVKIKNEKTALAEFLILMDKYKAGEITDFSVECITGREGKIIRLEKSWVLP
jgi:hypothetical protein